MTLKPSEYQLKSRLGPWREGLSAVASRESDFLASLYDGWSQHMAADPDMELTALRRLFEEWHVSALEPKSVCYAEADAGGVPALWCMPNDCAHDRVLLYTHGGGLVVGSRHTHRKIAGHLAKATGIRALVLDYRRAPEHRFPAQLEDTLRAHRWLLSQGFASEHIATGGDSAGGNLAISSALRLAEDGFVPPVAVVAFSPWLDMELQGESLQTRAHSDMLVNKSLLEAMIAMFLGDAVSPRDPHANPLCADLSRLPPVYVTAGGSETLLDDAQRFAQLARTAGAEVELCVAPGMQHVYQLMAGRAREADQSIIETANWLKPKLGLTV